MNDQPWRTSGRIRQSLLSIRNVWPVMVTLARRQTDDEPVTGSSSSPMPLPAHLLDVRARCEADLRTYATFILQHVQRGDVRDRVDGRSVESLAEFIDRWALHLVEQHPAAGERCALKVGDHAAKLRELVRGDQIRRYRLGRCPELVMVDEARPEALIPCQGSLWASMRQGDALLPKWIRCDGDHVHEWHPSEWAGLGRRLDATLDRAS